MVKYVQYGLSFPYGRDLDVARFQLNQFVNGGMIVLSSNQLGGIARVNGAGEIRRGKRVGKLA